MVQYSYILIFAAMLAGFGCASDSDDSGSDSAAVGDTDTSQDAATGPGSGDAASTADADISEEPMACPSVDSETAPGRVFAPVGVFQGQADGDSWAYRGVPFALPPTGDRRWREAEAFGCHDEVFVADEFGDRCPQFSAGGAGGLQLVGEEDCLTLNVWTPTGEAPDGGWPVAFFIHGGGHVQGSSSQLLGGGAPIYDGRFFAEREGVVVVTTNYRLGPLGFLPVAHLDDASEGASTGNFGLSDQIMALSWVATNIGAFGGDPARVLVFGESAGAVSTCMLVASDRASGLFSAALMQSGGCGATPLAAAQAWTTELLENSPCDSAVEPLTCLRDLPFADVLAARPGSVDIGGTDFGGGGSSYGPLVDGEIVVDQPLARIESGEHNAVPFVVGSNGFELGSLFTANPESEEDFESIVQSGFGWLGAEAVESILAAYPAEDYDSQRDRVVLLYSDVRFTCPARTIARAAAANQSEPVWRYLWNRDPGTPNSNGPTHGLELLYVFGSIESIPVYTPAPADIAVSDAMMGAWSALVRSGQPSGDGLPSWASYDPELDNHLHYDAFVEERQGVRSAQCDTWDALYESLGF